MLSVGQKHRHLLSVVASVMPDNPEPGETAMAAKFEISKDHAGKFRFHLKAPTARSSLPARVAEYPDQPQTAGSYLFEPSGSVHTFITPDTNTEDTVLFLRVEGADINFTEDGQFHSILDAVTIQHLVNQLTEARAVFDRARALAPGPHDLDRGGPRGGLHGAHVRHPSSLRPDPSGARLKSLGGVVWLNYVCEQRR
jgi:hypothetical protein